MVITLLGRLQTPYGARSLESLYCRGYQNIFGVSAKPCCLAAAGPTCASFVFSFKKIAERCADGQLHVQNHTPRSLHISSVPGGRDTRRWLLALIPSRRTWRARKVCELPNPRVDGVSVRLGLSVRGSVFVNRLHANCALALGVCIFPRVPRSRCYPRSTTNALD